MRQVTVQVPRGEGRRVLRCAEEHEARNSFLTEARGDDEVDVVVAHVPNERVGHLLEALEPLPQLRVTLLPVGTLPMSPGHEGVPEHISDVSLLSSVEVWLGGRQSIGSWRGFLGYTVTGAAVAWMAMYTDTAYLLIAAMLIAPFAGPAMNLAIATASGDADLARHALGRYGASLALAILVAGALSLALGIGGPTDTMVDVSHLAGIEVLLPLVAGVAAALNLVQSERSSLVSATAAGVLVAASLAPPAALIGMSAALGLWELTRNGAFMLLLQLMGINLAGSLTFRLFGVTSRGSRYSRGRPWVFYASVVGSAIALAALLTWQFSGPPVLRRAGQQERILQAIQEVVEGQDEAEFVRAEVNFTRSATGLREAMLAIVYVHRHPGVPPDLELAEPLREAIQGRLLSDGIDVPPLVHVQVLAPHP